jgi:hypothetical protein
MRAIFVVGAAAVALTFAAVAAAAVVASASGSGHITFGSSHEHNSFNATRADDGSVTGHAQVIDRTASGLVRFEVDINCLNVSGNVAILSGIVTSSNEESLVGMEALWQVVDNGEGADPPDLMSLVNLHEPGIGPDCTVPSEFDLVPLEGGNIRVEG